MSNDSPTRGATSATSVWPLALALAVAGGASAGALLVAGKGLRLAVVPFGWQRVVVAHVLCTLPLALAAARLLVGLLDLGQRWMAPLWAALGVLVAWLTLYAGAAAAGLASSEPDYVARLLWRIAWCLLLQTPWLLAALALGSRSAAAGRFSPAHQLLLGALVALAVPASYLATLLTQQSRAAELLWRQTRWHEALQIVQRLHDAGSALPLVDPSGGSQTGGPIVVTTGAALALMGEQIQAARREIDSLDGNPRGPAEDLRLGRLLAGVGDVPAAQAALGRAAQTLPEAALALCQLCQVERDFERSAEWAERSLRLAEAAAAQPPLDAAAEELRLGAYLQLALLAGERGDYAAAERHLTTALERLPRRQAAIHEQLARHYEFVGDIFRARAHRRQAASAEPERFPPPENLVYDVLSSGAPIGLARPGASRYR